MKFVDDDDDVSWCLAHCFGNWSPVGSSVLRKDLTLPIVVVVVVVIIIIINCHFMNHSVPFIRLTAT